MKYLWIEDFNGGKDRNELEKHWRQYYGLDNSELIIKTNLKDALEYINDFPEGFDAVLLDINFPITLSQNSDEVIYNQYLENIITREFYEKNKTTGAGMLLFLYLILKTRFPKERIAFLSANIEESIPSDIKKALSFVEEEKDIYNISDENFDSYNAMVESLSNKYGYVVDWKYLDEIDDLSDYIESIKKALLTINMKGKNNNDAHEISIKYNKAQEEFKKVGFSLSKAFPKPESEEKGQSKGFLTWMRNVESEYCRFRRCIIEMCNIVLSELNEDLIVFDKKYNNKSNDLSIMHFQELLHNMNLMPLIPTEDKEEYQYHRILSQISHDWESTKKPIYFLPQDGITVMCTNYKECVMNKFGYKKKIDKEFLCSRKNYNCEYLVDDKKCGNRNACIFSKDHKLLNKNRASLCGCTEKCEYQYTIQDFAYQSVLKMVRNWLAHSKLKKYDLYSAAFVFGIGMRASFDIDALKSQEYVKWEEELLNLISQCSNYNKNVKANNLIFEDKTVIRDVISKSCFDLYNIAASLNDFAYTPNISYIIHTIGGENSSLTCNTKYILRLFAHCLFPVEIQPKVNVKVSDYGFRLNVNTDFLKNDSSIEFKYLKAIYNAAFFDEII